MTFKCPFQPKAFNDSMFLNKNRVYQASFEFQLSNVGSDEQVTLRSPK